jgi:peptidoglycan hydrolase CwlO-like protein
MTQQFILQAQSVTGAVITVITLGLVAVIIGYFTAWLYAKSVYTPIVKGLEEDKAILIKQVDGLHEDIKKLNGRVDKLNEKISKLEEEVEEKEKEIKHLKKPKK